MTYRLIHHVEAAEHEAFLYAFEASSHLPQVSRKGLTFSPALRITDAVGGVNASLALAVGGPQRIQALVGAVDEILFGQRKVGRRLVMSARGHGSSSFLWPSIVPYFCRRRFHCPARVRDFAPSSKLIPA